MGGGWRKFLKLPAGGDIPGIDNHVPICPAFRFYLTCLFHGSGGGGRGEGSGREGSGGAVCFSFTYIYIFIIRSNHVRL